MRRGVNKEKQSTCSACPAEECVGGQTFLCCTCGTERDVCAEKVGDTEECVHCFEFRVLGPRWVEGWNRREGRALHSADRLVREAVIYQNSQEVNKVVAIKKE